MSWQGCVPRGLSKRISFLVFFSFQRLPSFLGSWPRISLTSASAVTSPSLPLPPLSHKDPCGGIRSVLCNLGQSPLTKFLWQHQVMYPGVLGMRMVTSLGAHYPADHSHIGESRGKTVETRGFIFLYGQKPAGNKEA